jgi:hypothetical protein
VIDAMTGDSIQTQMTRWRGYIGMRLDHPRPERDPAFETVTRVGDGHGVGSRDRHFRSRDRTRHGQPRSDGFSIARDGRSLVYERARIDGSLWDISVRE